MKLIDSSSADCVNCYKCLRNCPVKAISYANNKATVEPDSCILCGKCISICPQHAQIVRDDLDDFRLFLSENKVVASVAPSFIGDFNCTSFEEFRQKLLKVGFYDAEETIIGARITDNEYEKILKNSDELLISTACPTVINYVTKYYPTLIKYLAPVVSPMVAHAKLIKELDPSVKVAFIGPCLSKKDEITWEEGIVDFGLTFQEINRLFIEKNISFLPDIAMEEGEFTNQKIRMYPTSGGIIDSLNTKEESHSYVSCDGLCDVKSFLDEVLENPYKNTFLELSACSGSCINGPCRVNKNNYLQTKLRLNKYIKSSSEKELPNIVNKIDFSREFKKNSPKQMIPSSYEIRQILSKIGKKTEDDELNCGACGFSSCREKAIAVYNGKASLEMCLPYMKEKAESLSSEIIENSPNGIICFNSSLELQNINEKAFELLGIREGLSKEEINIEKYMDIYDFQILVSSPKNTIIHKKMITRKTERTIELNIVFVRSLDFVFGVFSDVTQAEYKEKLLHEVRKNTIRVTDSVIDKQMRSVQEIASLLGETVAETKIALTKLKKVMEDDDNV